MATKLRNLKVRKVDFVDEGANPDAHIMLYKSRSRAEGDAEGGGGSSGKNEGFWKRFVRAVFRTAGMGQEELDTAMEQIQKSGAASFGETMSQRDIEKVSGEMWDVFYALHRSFCSILSDTEMGSTEASEAMKESLDEFYALAKGSIREWAAGNTAGIVEKKDSAQEPRRSGEAETEKKEEPKGDDEEMKIDKSKMTPAERAFFEDIEKRYGVDGSTAAGEGQTAEPTQKGAGAAGMEDTVAKALQTLGIQNPAAAQEPQAAANTAADGDDNYQGLNPAVKAEIEALRKFREHSEERELREVAKQYAIIGKKEEELFPVLKSLKAAGGTAYNDMVAILDQVKETVEASGVFSEIGKSGHGAHPGSAPDEKSVEGKINGIAKGYMEKNPGMSYTQAVAKAWEENPELMAAYEEEAGF